MDDKYLMGVVHLFDFVTREISVRCLWKTRARSVAHILELGESKWQSFESLTPQQKMNIPLLFLIENF
jgi:hypothetical protein